MLIYYAQNYSVRLKPVGRLFGRLRLLLDQQSGSVCMVFTDRQQLPDMSDTLQTGGWF